MSKNKTSTIYHVRFLEAPDASGEIDFYFGSLAAIYDVFTSEQVGCKIENLWNKNLSDGGSWSGYKCSVTHCTLIRKKTNRGGHLK